jgi:hypothetical protein
MQNNQVAQRSFVVLPRSQFPNAHGFQRKFT